MLHLHELMTYYDPVSQVHAPPRGFCIKWISNFCQWTWEMPKSNPSSKKQASHGGNTCKTGIPIHMLPELGQRQTGNYLNLDNTWNPDWNPNFATSPHFPKEILRQNSQELGRGGLERWIQHQDPDQSFWIWTGLGGGKTTTTKIPKTKWLSSVCS